MITDEDEVVLRHLENIQLSDKSDPSLVELEDFLIVFHFSQNEYFDHKTLKIKLEYKNGNKDNIKSDTIKWKEGMDITTEIQQNISTGEGKKKTNPKKKKVQKPSFFRIFRNLDYESEDEESEGSKEDEYLYSYSRVSALIELMGFEFSKYHAPTFYGVEIPNYEDYLSYDDSDDFGDDEDGQEEDGDNDDTVGAIPSKKRTGPSA